MRMLNLYTLTLQYVKNSLKFDVGTRWAQDHPRFSGWADCNVCMHRNNALKFARFMQGSVTILVMLGLGIVFGLPYLMARTRKGRRGSKGGVLSSLFDFKKQSHKN